MTTEQREAIDRLKDDIKYADMRDTVDDDCTICFIDDLDTALSLIKEQSAELENKNKIINLIIDEFYKKAKISTRCYLQKSVEECMKYKNCKECLKQYFENKVNSKIQ